MLYRIYQISNTVNSLLYVGFTTGELQRRFRAHIKASRSQAPRHQNNPLYAAMKQYGTEMFSISLLEEGEKEYYEILDRELHWMRQLNTMCPHGYNRVYRALSHADAAIIRYDAYGLKGTEYAALFGLSVGTINMIKNTTQWAYYQRVTRDHLPTDITAYATCMGHTAAILALKQGKQQTKQ